jgi:hypothetical protein
MEGCCSGSPTVFKELIAQASETVLCLHGPGGQKSWTGAPSRSRFRKSPSRLKGRLQPRLATLRYLKRICELGYRFRSPARFVYSFREHLFEALRYEADHAA